MAINVRCECGATYRVKDEFQGKLMRCKSCDVKVRIEEAARRQRPAREEVLPEPTMESPEEKRQLQRELRRSREATNTSASNPGMLRVNYLQYAKAYPRWPMIWVGGLILSLACCVVSLWFAIAAAFFAFSTWFYFSRLKSQFVAGCVNPGIVVSMDPPLVAIYTDLTKGGNEFPVVKIESHPVHKMSTGPAAKGQQLTTVAFYESMEDELEHWTDFTPRLTACATTDRRVIQKQLKSIDDEDWEHLKAALKQVERPLTTGLYRYYPDHALDRQFELHEDQITELIENLLDDVSNCVFMSNGDRIPAEASSYIPREARSEIQVVVTSAKVSADESEGIVLSDSGAYYNFSELGKGAFGWEDVAGAFLARDVLEITFTDGERIEIPKSHFLSQTRVRLEILLDTIGRGAGDY